jgi:hypothetical protein
MRVARDETPQNSMSSGEVMRRCPHRNFFFRNIFFTITQVNLRANYFEEMKRENQQWQHVSGATHLSTLMSLTSANQI